MQQRHKQKPCDGFCLVAQLISLVVFLWMVSIQLA